MPRILTLLFLFVTLGCASSGRPPPIHRVTPGAVATPEHWATVEAEKVLRDGGNAVDAATCIGFVLAVTHPQAGNLGGGCFMVVHTAEEDLILDGRETAPRAATADMYLDATGKKARRYASLVGPLASGVPGSVAAYLKLHDRLGRLPRERVLAPAIRLAESGVEVNRALHDSIVAHRDLLGKFPETASVYLPDGNAPRRGSLFKQPGLAKVLKAISDSGADGFYRGWFPEQVQQLSEKYGGILTAGDFALYEPKVREPLRGTYREYDILTMPPPSSGGVCMLQILDMIERGKYSQMRPEQRMHLFTEASRRSFADRARYFADPDFAEVPVAELLNPEYLGSLFQSIRMDRATPSSEIWRDIQLSPESDETCHFSVVDGSGNAVSCTTTLNGAYGCGLAVNGVLLNNEMDDFTTVPGKPNQFGLIQSPKNSIEPGKRPLSSMTPTIVMKGGQPWLVVGSPGGPKIISVVAQVIANYLSLDMLLADAVAAPRIHNQWYPDEILFESLTPTQRRSLEANGHRLRQSKGPIGDVQAVGRTVVGSHPSGASDPRGNGRATR